jgi:RNA polymerase sigma factor (sigma-70 family)
VRTSDPGGSVSVPETRPGVEDIWGRRPTKETTLRPDPKQSIEELYRAHADRILRYARRRVSPPDAEEVVAQTFLVAWRRLHDVPDDPLPWLIGIARNSIRNLDRSRRRRSRLSARIASTQILEGQPAQSGELSEELHGALESLSPDDREVLLLIAWDELDYSDAAAAMGWSRANFRLRLHRARNRLKRRLEDGRPFSRSLAHRGAPEEAR